jgi:hypothetical protein
MRLLGAAHIDQYGCLSKQSSIKSQNLSTADSVGLLIETENMLPFLPTYSNRPTMNGQTGYNLRK